MKERFVIIHGTMGSPQNNWFPWLSDELSSLGHEVIVPRFPTPEGQSLASWFEVFSSQCRGVGQDSTIIGHSIGAVFLLRLLERMEQSLKRSVFVAGLTAEIGIPEYDSLNASFVSSPYQWEKIRTHAGKILCFLGDNDPYVPQVQGRDMADKLGVTPLIIRDGGHLNSESGFSTFPLLLDTLMEAGG